MKKRLFFLLALIAALGICIAGVVLFVLPGDVELAAPTVVYGYNRYLDRTMSVRSISYEDTHGFWAYYADNTDLESNLLVKNDGCGIQTGNIGEDQFLAVKIRVPAAGNYNMLQKYAPMNGNGGTADAHILSADTAADQIPTALTKKTKVGSLDFYGTDAEALTSDFGTVSFPAEGEYLVVYLSTGKNKQSTGNCFYIGDVTLQGNGQNVIMGLSASSEKNVLSIDETTKIAATAYLSSGETTEVTYKYESGNGNAIVGADGTVTAKAGGPVEIKVTASVADSTVTVPVRLNSIDYNFSGNYYEYNLNAGLPVGTAVQNVTYADAKNTWAYFADKGVANALTIQTYGIQDMNSHFNHYVAIKIQVPTAGEYLFSQSFGQLNTGCLAGVYVLPGNTTKEALTGALTEETMVGKVDFFSTSVSELVMNSTNLGMVSFPTAGEYIIVYKPINQFGVSNMFISDISLDGTGIKDIYLPDVDQRVYVRQTLPASVVVALNSGNQILLTGDDVNISISDEAKISLADGKLSANQEGAVTLRASASLCGQEIVTEHSVSVVQHPGKTEPTYRTYEMRRIARENIEQYSWASSIRNTAVNNADIRMSKVQTYYDLITREGFPRSRQIGFNGDANFGNCRYCGVNVQAKYGSGEQGGFNIDPMNHPWKVQCKECQRWFPSNDFGSFYKLGLDETGKFDYDKAWAENDKLIASGHPGYLVNELYPEKGKYWGVDDGYGAREYKDGSDFHKYSPNDSNLDKSKSAVYIPLWSFTFWQELSLTVQNFANAYIYTDDIQYARAGAMLLDRIADVTPEYNFRNYAKEDYLVSCGGTGYGVFIGRIHDPGIFNNLALGADAFFPMLDDPELIATLSANAQKLGLENDKSTGKKIWQNWRDNILVAILDMAEDGRLKGNYGIAECTVAIGAVVLGEEPESGKMMEWLYKTNTAKDGLTATGGNFISQTINVVDRDGFGNEAAPGYNDVWLQVLCDMADLMSQYKGDKSYNPYEHPKFVQMFLNWDTLVQSQYYTPQIGDSGTIANVGFTSSILDYKIVWKHLKDTPLAKDIAQYIYTILRGNLYNLYYDIYTENPESIVDEILAHIDKNAEQVSDMLSGYGFATLKDGVISQKNSMRSAWIYHGINQGHGHQDTLNLGIDAFGLNLAPDIGYPVATINDPTNGGFTRTTVAHNTVVVDNESQDKRYATGIPYIFDDSDHIKVMGVEAKNAYLQTESYNRTLVMVKVDNTNSYYVDFFRVLGGRQHTYSFHSQSHTTEVLSGLTLTKQVDANGNYVGTYASPNIAEGGAGTFPIGHNYFTKVRRDTALAGNSFSIDFPITDYHKYTGTFEPGIHLKMTQINSFTPDEVAVVGGHVLTNRANYDISSQTSTLEYVLTQHKAKDDEQLDSLFMTVFEPYKLTSYLQTIEEVPVTVVSGTPGEHDLAKALLITHKDGRKDYIFYATNNEITYRVADLFNVRGYVAAYSLGNDGKEAYRYVSGGNIIVDELQKTAVYTGKVLNFSTDLTLYENFIDVDLEPSVAEQLAGRYIYIDNDGRQNAVYEIASAKPIDGGVRLDLGTVSLVRSMRDKENIDAGFFYNIATSQTFQIPMSYLTTP